MSIFSLFCVRYLDHMGDPGYSGEKGGLKIWHGKAWMEKEDSHSLTHTPHNRNNIAAAKLANLERDLNLSSVQYQTSVSILFVGYLLMQLPSNLFLNKFGKPAIYLPCCVGPLLPSFPPLFTSSFHHLRTILLHDSLTNPPNR